MPPGIPGYESSGATLALGVAALSAAEGTGGMYVVPLELGMAEIEGIKLATEVEDTMRVEEMSSRVSDDVGDISASDVGKAAEGEEIKDASFRMLPGMTVVVRVIVVYLVVVLVPHVSPGAIDIIG
jgi:hypothetical protein